MEDMTHGWSDAAYLVQRNCLQLDSVLDGLSEIVCELKWMAKQNGLILDATLYVPEEGGYLAADRRDWEED